ncbi:MAG: hypothetical protein K2L14_03315 [Duncaniella sp.]|nr:hypothetical protein [Duncaniella sp.]
MQYDLIYPADFGTLKTVPCIIAAAYFNADELIGFGVDQEAMEIDDAFVEENEFEKVFRLWDSPSYLRKFFLENAEYFEQEYWSGITEDEFVTDVTRSINEIRKELINLFNTHSLHSIVEPLGDSDMEERDYKSIRVKIKQGWIFRRLAFRFYAVEVEEDKCYLITGGAIKIHKDMLKAPNTRIEMNKVEYALAELNSNGVDTKELFIDFISAE